MTKNVTEVETSHGDLGDDHLKEGGEGREDAEFVLVKSKSSSSAEVATLHD